MPIKTTLIYVPRTERLSLSISIYISLSLSLSARVAVCKSHTKPSKTRAVLLLCIQYENQIYI